MKRSTVLLASIFVLLFAVLSDSYADHRNNPNAQHGGGLGGDKTMVTVEVITEPVAGRVDTVDTTGTANGGCEGQTDDTNLGLAFRGVVPDNRKDCGPVKVTFNNAVLDLYLLQIGVKETKNKTTVDFFFTHDPDSSHVAPNSSVYHTGSLLALITRFNDGSLQINGIDGSWGNNVALTKNHQPLKGDVSVSTITVGTIVYTPIN